MRIMPTRVAMVIPNTTAVPISAREAEPELVASSSGTQPSINANEVIRIGRRRSFAPASAAFHERVALFAPELGKLDYQDGVFRGQTDEHHKTNLCVDVVVEVPRNQADECSEHDERRAKQHCERQRPASILRS